MSSSDLRKTYNTAIYEIASHLASALVAQANAALVPSSIARLITPSKNDCLSLAEEAMADALQKAFQVPLFPPVPHITLHSKVYTKAAQESFLRNGNDGFKKDRRKAIIRAFREAGVRDKTANSLAQVLIAEPESIKKVATKQT